MATQPAARPAPAVEPFDPFPPEADDWHLMAPPPHDDDFFGFEDFGAPPARPKGISENRDYAPMRPSAPNGAAAAQPPEAPRNAPVEHRVKEQAPVPPVRAVGENPVTHLSMPFFVTPTAKTGVTGTSPADGVAGEEAPRMVTVILRPGENKPRDVRRLKRIHGTLLSYPGNDKFSFLVFEGGRRFLMEFPNDTTGICPDLLRKLIELAGEGNVSVEPIKIL